MEPKNRLSKFGVGTALTLVLVIWFGWWLVGPWLFCANFEKLGQMGDMFGSVNTLFTGLAFVGLIYTIQQQRMQSADAKREYEENRTSERIQRFENTFFQLLGVLNTIVDSTDVWQKGVERDGRDAFTIFNDRLKAKLAEFDRSVPRADAINRAYQFLLVSHGSDLPHYFRMLYRILKWIDASEVPDKRFYAKIVRAQLSPQELLLLLYNSQTEYGKKMKPLLERYSMLKHVDRLSLATEDFSAFDIGAFKEPEAS